MSVFKDYAKYYNLLYREKDYKSEAEYVMSLINKYSQGKVKTILNMGCGTGNHDRRFYDMGYDVDAFDMSAEMIKAARELSPAGINYHVSTIKDFNNNKKYDAIVSLFHVMSYQVKNEDVNAMFRVVREHLNPGGVFLFDFWYGPGVLTDLPVRRVKEIKDGDIIIRRKAVPEHKFNENVVVVNYDVEVLDKEENILERTEESHYMRYFFLPETEIFADNNSCRIIAANDWMKTNEPELNSWNICITGTLK
jgi:SAM-dependent methyltransferase